MKQAKALLLPVMAAVAISAGTAEATILESGGAKVGAGTSFIATLETGSSVSLSTTGGTQIKTCTSSEVKGSISNAGGASATVSGPVSTLEGGGCTGVTTNQAANGNLEIHHIAGTDDGTLTGSGFTVTVHTAIFGLEKCTFGAGSAIDLGTLTGSAFGNATADVDAPVVLSASHSNTFLCPSDARLVGKYEVTAPNNLQVTSS